MGILQFMNKPSEIPELLKSDYSETCKIIEDFLFWLKFSVCDTSRDPKFGSNNLLSFLEQDMIETLIVVLGNIQDGAHNPAKRELRFLLELSIKMAFVQQNGYAETIQDKIKQYKDQINSTNIGIRNQITFNYISPENKIKLNEESGRIYGEASIFVHLTVKNMTQRIEKIENGHFIGNESLEELRSTNVFLKNILTYCMVFIIESLPEYVVGDWFGMLYPETENWYYLKSKYIAEVDSYFDYKAEREKYLNELIKMRKMRIEY